MCVQYVRKIRRGREFVHETQLLGNEMWQLPNKSSQNTARTSPAISLVTWRDLNHRVPLRGTLCIVSPSLCWGMLQPRVFKISKSLRYLGFSVQHYITPHGKGSSILHMRGTYLLCHNLYIGEYSKTCLSDYLHPETTPSPPTRARSPGQCSI